MRAILSSRKLLLILVALMTSGSIFGGDDPAPISVKPRCTQALDQKPSVGRSASLSVNCQIVDDGDPTTAVPPLRESIDRGKLGQQSYRDGGGVVTRMARSVVTGPIAHRKRLLYFLPQFTE